jgi:AcrR family transcriptional regulator
MISSKDRILDAAERVVTRCGAAHLTLDAVAQEATLSKGGVLYHFATKEDLIRAMVERMSVRFHADLHRLAESDPEEAGRNTRAYIHSCFPSPTALSAPCDPVAVGLVAAVANSPALLEPLRKSAVEVQQHLWEDRIDPVLATVIKLAVDGLWMADLFGVNSLDPSMRTQVIDRLQALTQEHS